MICSKIASQNTGIDTIRIEITFATKSPRRPREWAAIAPSGIPTIAAKSKAIVTRTSVVGNTRKRSSTTGALVWSEIPKSPCAIPLRYVTNCSQSEPSSPNRSRTAASCSAVARGPAYATAGSPGISRAIRKVRTTTPTTTPSACTTREARYLAKTTRVYSVGVRPWTNTTLAYAGLFTYPVMVEAKATWELITPSTGETA